MLGGAAEGLGLGRGVLDLLGFCLSAPFRFLRLPGCRQERDAEALFVFRAPYDSCHCVTAG